MSTAATLDRVSAALTALRALDALPAGVAEGLWRHAEICTKEASGACDQGHRMIAKHLTPLLESDPEWDGSLSGHAALQFALSARRLPFLLGLT